MAVIQIDGLSIDVALTLESNDVIGLKIIANYYINESISLENENKELRTVIYKAWEYLSTDSEDAIYNATETLLGR